jgi:hypothetical protein
MVCISSSSGVRVEPAYIRMHKPNSHAQSTHGRWSQIPIVRKSRTLFLGMGMGM